jgi:hypothetical protein
MLSVLAYMDRNFDMAVELAQRAIKICNNTASYHHNLGIAGVGCWIETIALGTQQCGYFVNHLLVIGRVLLQTSLLN